MDYKSLSTSIRVRKAKVPAAFLMAMILDFFMARLWIAFRSRARAAAKLVSESKGPPELLRDGISDVRKSHFLVEDLKVLSGVGAIAHGQMRYHGGVNGPLKSARVCLPV